MTKESNQYIVESAVEDFAPSDCPVIEGTEPWKLISAAINYENGITVKCDGTNTAVCQNCSLNKQERTKIFLPG